MTEQEQKFRDLITFDYMTITNNGYPLLSIVVRDSMHLRKILRKIKREFNLNIIVWFKINGISNKNYYLAVEPLGKYCYSYIIKIVSK